MSTINERVKLIMDFKGENTNSLGKKIGTSRQSVTNIINDVNKPSYDFIESLLHIYPDISTDYLIRGEEPMIRGEINEYIKKTDKREDLQSVPLYSFEAAAGLTKLFSNSESVLHYISIPNLPKSDGAIYISGDSMYPLLKSGDIVIYKQIHDIKNNIFFGEMYLLSVKVDDDYLTLVKYIQRSEKGEEWVCLVSQNQHHPPKDIPIENIRALAYIKASIRINSMV